jgi:CBS domain-containing protein
MKVHEVMTREAKTCTPETKIAEAAWLMWEGDCGILPVVTGEGRVVGLVTDRDICKVLVINPEPVKYIPVSRIITGNVYACKPEADLHDALKTMQQHRVRRLPVINDEGRLQGVLSMNDVVLEAKESKTGITYADVVTTMKAICGHRDLPQIVEQPVQQRAAIV